MKNHKMKAVSFAALLFLIGCLGPQSARATTPFLGEIRWVAFNFAPAGWAQCNGQLLLISQNEALFALLGTTFGGDGVSTFALPDMRSRAPIHVSPGYALGGTGGEENHTLTVAELPTHGHALKADQREGTAAGPAGNYPAKTSGGTSAYGSSVSGSLASRSVGSTGGGQPHPNMKPYITLNCIISLQGIFPSQQ